MRCIRWLGAFKGDGILDPVSLIAALDWEVSEGALIERAAEPLWRGRTIVGPRSRGVGLVYDQADVAHAFGRDAWSERAGARLRPSRDGALRRWRDIDAFARAWDRRGPKRDIFGRALHGEVFLRRGARPIAVALAPHAPRWAVDTARAWAAERGLPLVGINRVENG